MILNFGDKFTATVVNPLGAKNVYATLPAPTWKNVQLGLWQQGQTNFSLTGCYMGSVPYNAAALLGGSIVQSLQVTGNCAGGILPIHLNPPAQGGGMTTGQKVAVGAGLAIGGVALTTIIVAAALGWSVEKLLDVAWRKVT